MILAASILLLTAGPKAVNAGPRFSGYLLPHVTYIVQEGARQTRRSLGIYATGFEALPSGSLAVVTDGDNLLVLKGGRMVHRAAVPAGAQLVGGWRHAWPVVRDSPDEVFGFEWPAGKERAIKHVLPPDSVRSVASEDGFVVLDRFDFYGYHLTTTKRGLVEDEGDSGFMVQVVNKQNHPDNRAIGEPGAEITANSVGVRYVAIQVKARGKVSWFIADPGHVGSGSLALAPWKATAVVAGKDAAHAIAATAIQPLDLSRPLSSTRLWSVDLKTLKRTLIGTVHGYVSPCGVSDDGGWLIGIRHEPSGGKDTLVATNLVSMKTLAYGPAQQFMLSRK